ncbi:hypothetical protein ACV07N_06495 [Roseivirga echinicomitans]
MRKIKTLVALSVFLAAMALPAFQSQDGGPMLCYTGRLGEAGTWKEGSCIEHETINHCGFCVPSTVE